MKLPNVIVINLKQNIVQFLFNIVYTFLEDSPIMSKRKKTNIQLPMSNFQSTSASNTEDNHDQDEFIFNKVDVGIWYIF